jgi:hypothetical protein
MSAIFKSNSRFAVLAEEINNNPFNKKEKREEKRDEKRDEKREENVFKKEGNCFTSNSSNSFNNYDNQRYIKNINRDFESIKSKELREKREKEEKDKKKKIKEEVEKKALTIENFPNLLGNIKNTQSEIIIPTDFIDKVKFVKPVIEINNLENLIKPGWIEIQHDPILKRIITTKNTKFIYGNNGNNDNNDNNADSVLRALVDLHESRTKDYINMWGYDTWETTFTYPNYDYDYFNRLDEQYQEEHENEIENESYYGN